MGDDLASVAVVGGAGFIGQRLSVALRNAGHDVAIVDLAVPAAADRAYRRADVRSREALRVALDGAEVVYNLAAVHRDDIVSVTEYEEVNVSGAYNICCVCRELGISRIVFTSSAAVYGIAAPGATEDGPTAPSHPYGRTKLLAEGVHREWQSEASGGRTLVIVRPTVVFGEGNRGNVYELMRQIKAGRFVMVGNGRNRKSMAYVGNLSEFLVHVLSLGTGAHLFNYVDGPDMSMDELVETILRTLRGRRPVFGVRVPYVVGYLGGVACDLMASATGRRLPISAVRIKKFCSTSTFSAQRANATGFRPRFALHEALVRTIRHEIGRR